MGGLEAIAELKKIDPLARVIVSSGYSNDDVLQNFARYGFHAVVPKPYAPQELEEALVRVLKVP
jgi:DNA-binding NarL/FixJ family response regulator